MQRHSLKAASLTLATLATLAGCGDSGATLTTTTATTGDDSSGDPETTTPTTPPTTDGPTSDPPTTEPTTEPNTGDTSSTGDSATTEPLTSTTVGTETGHMTDVMMTTGAPDSCDDAEINQEETDVDCGGPNCGPCPDGSACTADADCQIASCVLSICAAPTCSDGVQNASETAVDCGGGECPTCTDGLACAVAEDCASQVCTEGLCAAPTCADAVSNGEETDVDCGGSICDGCLGGLECIEDSDCLSAACNGGICEDVDCLIDSDCGDLDTDCTVGACVAFECVPESGNEGMACAGADLCVLNTTCTDGVCGGGAPVDCSAMSDACHLGSCDPQNGECISTELDDGTKCEDGNPCTKLETCNAGTCGGSLTALFTEDFSDNLAMWTLGPEWAIAPAKASVGCSGGQDPALDHTPTDDNGVAGVVVGGCIINKQLHDFYCLTSPKIDLTTAVADVHVSFWRWLISDYTPYIKNVFQVLDSNNAWVTLFETGGFPGAADNAWKFFSYDVSPYKHANFQARWCFNIGSAGAFSSPSWNVDDVTVGPNACMQ